MLITWLRMVHYTVCLLTNNIDVNVKSHLECKFCSDSVIDDNVCDRCKCVNRFKHLVMLKTALT